MTSGILSSSFRDPSGFLFRADGRLMRQVNQTYADDYRLLMKSGLYDILVRKGLLIPHEEVSLDFAPRPGAYKMLRPVEIPFISYPYEWAFSQLKDAALTTLRIQKLALKKGMTLKDASAYNIQFNQGRPVLIDTLSFTGYQDGSPWIAYGQFCRHFLAPLALMAYRDVRLAALLRTNIDGIPLDLASRLLPTRTRVKPGLVMHLHAHAASQKKHEKAGRTAKRPTVSKKNLVGIIDSLRSVVQGLKWKLPVTEWGDYYDNTNYSDDSLLQKKKLVEDFLIRAEATTVWDLGANNGFFSRIASDRGLPTLASDIDPVAVELNYLDVRRNEETNLLPLVLDLTNPSPALGWAHSERMSFLERGPVDLVIALALVHHLAISNNVPLDQLARFFAEIGHWLILEFVPKRDSKVQRLLATREDVFPHYTEDDFEAVFSASFDVVEKSPVPGSERTLYLLRKQLPR